MIEVPFKVVCGGIGAIPRHLPHVLGLFGC